MLRNMELIEVLSGTGHIAVEATGDGPLVLCVPGMGETRASFRHLTPGLVEAGYRTAVMDLRGHGDSSVEFEDYDDEAAATDILAVIDALGADSATVIGNSMGAAAAVLAAAERPQAVQSLVLIGPFVRDHGSAFGRFALRLLLLRPWGPLAWKLYYRSLFGDQRPEDHDEHIANAHAKLKRPGRWRAFQKTTRTSHAPAEAALGAIDCPTLVIMGSKDRDFGDPQAEAEWIAEQTRGSYKMIDGAGHYPMGEQPQEVLSHVVALLTDPKAEEASNG